MRKVLSLVLVLALVLGSFSMAFAATPTDVVGTPSEEAVSVLTDLGVIDGMPSGLYEPAGIVTRAQMAKLIVAALGLSDYATGTTTKYSDMAGAAWAQGYVSYATGLGVVSGYPDGTFKPSAPVSYTEAAAMIVRALGYTEASLLPATWPANFMVKAKALGILDDIDSTVGGANRGDVAIMLYAALGANIGTYNLENGWVKNSPDDTMLVRLSSSSTTAAVIRGTEKTAINLRPYVGVYATTFKNSDGEIIAVVAKSDTLYGDFVKADKTFTTNVGEVEYKISDAVSTLTTATAVRFDNGVFTDLHNLGAIGTHDDAYIAVDLSGKTIDEVYSISDWNLTDADLFDEYYATEITKHKTLMGSTNKFLLTDEDVIDLNSFELFGAASLGAIKDESVVYVYNGGTGGTSATGTITRIEVGTEVVTGKITRVSGNASDGYTFTINGKELTKVAPAVYVGETLDTASIGDTGTARLDYNGDIYDWEVTDATADNYAIVLATEAADTTGITSNAQVKLLTKDGTETIFTLADLADVNALEPAGSTPSALVSDLDLGDLVVYSTDSDGDIDVITEKYLTTGGTAQLNDARTLYGAKVVDPAVVVFTVDTSTTPDTYDVAKLSTVDTKVNLTSDFYYAPSKVDVLLLDSTNAASGDSIFAVVNTLGTEINADGDTVAVITGLAKGAAYTGTTNHSNVASFDDPADGTLVMYKLTVDADKIITAVEKNHSADAVGTLAYTATDEVYARDGSFLLQFDNGGDWFAVDSAVVVYEFDASAKKYTEATITSVRAGSVVTMWQSDIDSEVYDFIIVTI